MLPTLLFWAIAAAGQPLADSPSGNDAAAKGEEPLEGIWFTQKTIEGIIGRWVDQTADKYELDPRQTERLETLLLERWPQYLADHRRTLQPLLNEYLEARLARDPPDAETVRVWAERATPAFEGIQQQWLETQRQVQGVLTPQQQARFTLDALTRTAALQAFQEKLKTWRRGAFEEHDWWDPPRHVRRQRRREREHAERADDPILASATRRVDEELLRWDRFVAEFVERFHLDDAQIETAHSILRECKQRARAHLDRQREPLERLENAAETETDLAAATSDRTQTTDQNEIPADQNAEKPEHGDRLTDEQTERITALYGPIDAIFVELKTRLEAIPTAAQSAAQERNHQ